MDSAYLDFLDMIEGGLATIKAVANVLLHAPADLLDEETLPSLAGLIEREAGIVDHLVHVLFRALMGARS